MPADPDARRIRRRRIVLCLGVLALFILSANLAGTWLVELLDMELTPHSGERLRNIIMLSTILYVLLIAVPFVPGIEMGLALLIMAGPSVALLVYGATVLGLSLAYLLGYLLPVSWLRSLFEYLQLARASRLIEQMEPLDTGQRLSLLVSKAPSASIPFLLRHRYIALAVALNIPGNACIGGGGGISLLAGISRLFSPPTYLVMLIVAVAPVPMAVLIFGRQVLAP